MTAFAIAAWSAAAAWINPAQFADSLEQFAWAHGVELGYWKHPPLPTWLIIAPIRLIGFSIYWTYALAAACFAGTHVDRRFSHPQGVALAVLFNHRLVVVVLSALVTALKISSARTLIPKPIVRFNPR